MREAALRGRKNTLWCRPQQVDMKSLAAGRNRLADKDKTST
jgi:hypothetical protein